MAETNKAIAVSFLELASSGKVREAFERYASPNFRHHNLYFRGDAASLARGMEESFERFPNKVLDVQRVLGDGDLVAVHLRVRLEPTGADITLIHIFRFEGGRIAELWEAAQEVLGNTVNENGAF